MQLDGITYVFKGAKQKHVVAIDFGSPRAGDMGGGNWPCHVNGNETRLNWPNKSADDVPTPDYVREQLLKDAD